MCRVCNSGNDLLHWLDEGLWAIHLECLWNSNFKGKEEMKPPGHLQGEGEEGKLTGIFFLSYPNPLGVSALYNIHVGAEDLQRTAMGE